MLQKILLTIDADENSMVTFYFCILDAVNFMSAVWNDVFSDTIRNCFFRSLTPAVPDEPFLGFSLDEVPTLFTQETYTQYVNLNNNFEVTGL